MISVSASRVIWGNEMLSANISTRLLSGFCLLTLLALSTASEAQSQNTAAPPAAQQQNQQQAPAAAANSADSVESAAASQNVPADTGSGQTAATAALDAELTAAEQAQADDLAQAQAQAQAETETEAADSADSGQTSSIADVELFDPQSDEPLDPQQSGGRFIPTEQLSLDLGVSFPVDI